MSQKIYGLILMENDKKEYTRFEFDTKKNRNKHKFEGYDLYSFYYFTNNPSELYLDKCNVCEHCGKCSGCELKKTINNCERYEVIKVSRKN
jgi:hypothetical protein